ncbi:MAG TPA: hypothetical protein VGR28_08150 [Candidatus Thermoplasmatota archaeon]|jgi:hypothetical protein|nr:hypothetical protein [Candidatus Thermoplasmatota archaeon]
MRLQRAIPVLVLATAGLLLAPGIQGAIGPADTYLAGSTLVVKPQGAQPILDDGGAICVKSSPAPSLGGGCVAFGLSVLVNDAGLGDAVAFQVCIDNDGDGVCKAKREACGDDIFFSHYDSGRIDNPIGPLPGGFRPGCPGGPWQGYVVLLCEGVHGGGNAGGVNVPAHAHAASTGSIAPTGLLGEGNQGNFCNAGLEAPPKPYRVI